MFTKDHLIEQPSQLMSWDVERTSKTEVMKGQGDKLRGWVKVKPVDLPE